MRRFGKFLDMQARVRCRAGGRVCLEQGKTRGVTMRLVKMLTSSRGVEQSSRIRLCVVEIYVRSARSARKQQQKKDAYMSLPETA